MLIKIGRLVVISTLIPAREMATMALLIAMQPMTKARGQRSISTMTRLPFMPY